jgi:hypothetical protein
MQGTSALSAPTCVPKSEQGQGDKSSHEKEDVIRPETA